MLKASKTASWPAIAVCTLVAMFEGLDIQSMGVVAPRVAKAFGATPQGMGLVLSASIIGLLFGAALGGWLSDRMKRRTVLAGSLALLGAFSFATSGARSYDALVLLRLLAGFGLGGVLPNLIAITADLALPRWRATALALVYCGMPAGGAVAAWVTSLSAPGDWQLVFLVGGIGPLALAPLVLVFVPPITGRGTSDTRGESGASLFGPRSAVTLLLWLAYFFTLLAVYLLLNWLPSMMTARGLGPAAAAHAALLLNIGAVAGSLLFGRAIDRGRFGPILLLVYLGMLGGLAALIGASDRWLPWAVFGAGFFVIGGQLVLYALAPMVYPIGMRGTGVGAAVAAGRFGSILGPLLAGFALEQGLPPVAVPMIAIPGIALAMGAALRLVARYPIDSEAQRS